MKSMPWCLLLLPALVFSQNQAGYHEHDGFYLSMSAGPAAGNINLDASGATFDKAVFSGGGGMLDFKIGGAIKKTIILSCDIAGRTITGPTMEVDGVRFATSSDLSASDVMVGLGVTYYFMPENLFFSGTIGIGSFQLSNNYTGFKVESEQGFGISVKVGKEWWVSKNWALGVSGGFAHINADDKQDPNNAAYLGKLMSNKIFVLFNTTYN